MSKPKPIILGVSGIAPQPITMNTPLPDWREICAIPPFQMFVRERGQKDEDSLHAAIAYVQSHNPNDVWADYVAWFENKGYWKNENPDGSIKT